MNNYYEEYCRYKKLYLDLLQEGSGRTQSRKEKIYKKTTEYLLYLISIGENISSDPYNPVYKYTNYDYPDTTVDCCCCQDKSIITFNQVDIRKLFFSRSSPRSSPTLSDSESDSDSDSPILSGKSQDLLRTLGHDYSHASFIAPDKKSLPEIFKGDDYSGGYVIQNILFMCKLCNNAQGSLTFKEFFKNRCTCGRSGGESPPIMPDTITFEMPNLESHVIRYTGGINNQIIIARNIYKLFDSNRSPSLRQISRDTPQQKLFMGLKKYRP